MINQSSVNTALAFPLIDNTEITVNSSNLLYQGNNNQKTARPDIGVRLQKEKIEVAPAKPQNFIDPSDFNNKILEKISKQFQEASAFLNDKNR
ncbi:MAG: hypothetical protein AB4041_14620 [Microcystaceae cyanobacterium]